MVVWNSDSAESIPNEIRIPCGPVYQKKNPVPREREDFISLRVRVSARALILSARSRSLRSLYLITVPMYLLALEHEADSVASKRTMRLLDASFQPHQAYVY